MMLRSILPVVILCPGLALASPVMISPDAVLVVDKKTPLELAYFQTSRLADADIVASPKGTGVQVTLKIRDFKEPAPDCAACLALVVWAISPSGRPHNLGTLQKHSGKFPVPLREFAVAVTEEPHFAVDVPCGEPLLVAGGGEAAKGAPVLLSGAFGRDPHCPAGRQHADLDPWSPPILAQARNARLMALAHAIDMSDPEEFDRADRRLVEAERARARGTPEEIYDHALHAVQVFAEARRNAPRQSEQLAALDLRDAPAPLPSGLVGRVSEFFEPEETTLSASAAGRILDFALSFESDPSVGFRIRGHTDAEGTQADNQAVASQRAAAVYELLRDAGIPESRIRAFALGDTLPAASNDSETGRQLNRRVEIEAIRGTF